MHSNDIVVASHLTAGKTVDENVSHNVPKTPTQVFQTQTNTYRLVAVGLVVEHGGSLGSIAPGLHGPQPHLVLWETLQQINR